MKTKNRKKRIVVKDYIKHKDELDRYCVEHLCGYEIRHDGTAVVTHD